MNDSGTLLTLSIRRPVATAMFFLALALLGIVAWFRLPVELFPNLSGDETFVVFRRPGSEPEVVEREILLPLERRVEGLPRLAETWGEIRGDGGSLRIRFERGTKLTVRELELQRIAADLVRQQPRGTSITVQTRDTSVMSRFAMSIQALSLQETDEVDRFALHDLLEERVVPRLEAVPGVGQVLVGGGAGRQVTVEIDADRAAAVGVSPDEILTALRRGVGRRTFLGGLEEGNRRTNLVLDGRPGGLVALGRLRIHAGSSGSGSPAELRHVARLDAGGGRETFRFRVNGRPAVGLFVFQEEGVNLVRLGRELRGRLAELRGELQPLGIELVVSLDAAELVEEQIERLEKLALIGFAVALFVLYLFLRRFRAVLVMATSVPVSLLAALAFLDLGGQSLNLITLFGLAVGIGLLVDNSVVVYEAVERRLERGHDPAGAVAEGLRRTVRAIVAASVTTAVVFLPLALIEFDDALVQGLLELVALAILLPLGGSLLVAVGLVPLLAHRLAAPAAVRRLAEDRRRRRELGRRPPDRLRGVFTGLLMTALRRPSGWIAGVVVAVVVTLLVAVPWVLVRTATTSTTADEVRLAVRLGAGRSLDAATKAFERLELAALELDGVDRVESAIQEEEGSLTVYLDDEAERPDDLTIGRVEEAVRQAAKELREVEILRPGEGGGGGGDGGGGGGLGGLLGGAPAKVVLSGAETAVLDRLARQIESRLETFPEVAAAWPSVVRGQPELWVIPDDVSLAARGLVADEVMPVLRIAGREGVRLPVGLTQESGRELPILVKRPEARLAGTEALRRLRLQTPAGVLPVAALADLREMPAPPIIHHHNGRREVEVLYRLAPTAPSTGPARLELEENLAAAVRAVRQPPGVSVEVPEPSAGTDWFRRFAVPAILLLALVLAMTFESLTLPVLVLLALPLTLLGATWALVLAGLPMDVMALVGAVPLLGLTVNPAILLVDRMQSRRLFGGWSAGAAALAAVRERARPVAMTTATTVAGLWPLALQTGRENEIWPPFATIMIGGLLTSTLLTLLVIPVGYVFLARLDGLFGRLGPWVVLGWLTLTTAVMVPLVRTGLLTSLLWQVVTAGLVGGMFLGVAAFVFWRPEPPEPAATEGPPVLEARHLRKVYGRPGPVGRAWRAPERFARKVLAEGGRAFDPREVRRGLVAWLGVAAGLVFLAFAVRSIFWRLVFLFAATVALGGLVRGIRRARGRVDDAGRTLPGGVEGILAAALPWAGVAWVAFGWGPFSETPEVRGVGLALLAALVAVVQLGRWTAQRLAEGEIPELAEGFLRRSRTLWRKVARTVFGLDLSREEVRALERVSFQVERGMVGVLGPNGAGKTTLLRQVAGILEPSAGRITLGGVHLGRLRRYLGRWVGYLPQDAALPASLTAREVLEYYALLYEIPADERAGRVDHLLREVGLGERADEAVGGFSGGMRQRVAVARALLRLPPVILVDEPTVGLDPRERIRFRNLLSRLAEGRVVLFSTHVVEDVAVACERVLVLAGGRLVFDGPPEDLAEVARGRIFEAVLDTNDVAGLPRAVRIADQVPEGAGRSRVRLIADEPPHPEARPVDPSLEEGYLLLVGGKEAA